MDKNNIVLIGMMGTGKSTVGKRLAERLRWRFVDTDERIEQEQGITISTMFVEQGEAAFREAESNTIERVLIHSEQQVVATGGGAVLAERNREAMIRYGFVVALTASAEAIVGRVRNDRNRPLLEGNIEERVRTIMEERQFAYQFADLTVDTTNRTANELAAYIFKQWTARHV